MTTMEKFKGFTVQAFTAFSFHSIPFLVTFFYPNPQSYYSLRFALVIIGWLNKILRPRWSQMISSLELLVWWWCYVEKTPTTSARLWTVYRSWSHFCLAQFAFPLRRSKWMKRWRCFLSQKTCYYRLERYLPANSSITQISDYAPHCSRIHNWDELNFNSNKSKFISTLYNIHRMQQSQLSSLSSAYASATMGRRRKIPSLRDKALVCG